MTILEVLQNGRINLQSALDNEPENTKEYFTQMMNRLKAQDYFYNQEEGLKKYKEAVFYREDRLKWTNDTLQELTKGKDVEVGYAVNKIVSVNDMFLQRLFTDWNPIHIYQDLYFYPFQDGEAIYGHITRLPNGTIYFQGIVVDEVVEYALIEIVKTDWNFLK